MEKMDKFIAPPRLNRKHVVFGYTVWELGALLALFILLLFTRKPFFAPIMAFVAVLSFRPPGNERNAYAYLKILFRYFHVSQVYRLRECVTHENQ